MSTFQQAFERLLSRAPGPVFPRARELYLRKYPLEFPAEGPFRTFLLQEEILESESGAVRVRGLAFAVVHWQAPQAPLQAYGQYLRSQWQLGPEDLALCDEAWFRQGGAWAMFSAAAVFERTAPTTLLSSSVDPGAPGADPGSSR
jgi:hypothetical protein